MKHTFYVAYPLLLPSLLCGIAITDLLIACWNDYKIVTELMHGLYFSLFFIYAFLPYLLPGIHWSCWKHELRKMPCDLGES